MATIANVLHPDAIRSLADGVTFRRGEAYFRQGRVSALRRERTGIRATVGGSEQYAVRIWVKGDGLAYTCSCPAAGDGSFCKHCVAVTLAWVSQAETASREEQEEESLPPAEQDDERGEAPSGVAVVVKPPSPLPDAPRSVFLAGSIDMGRAPRWQSRLAESLADMDGLAILDPRRDEWDDGWQGSAADPRFREQAGWELEAMERADAIAVCFKPESQAPDALLELGLHARSGKLVVLCPEGYSRKGNVDMVCRRYGVHRVEDFEELVAALRARLSSVSR